jgi:hypothetical protein
MLFTGLIPAGPVRYAGQPVIFLSIQYIPESGAARITQRTALYKPDAAGRHDIGYAPLHTECLGLIGPVTAKVEAKTDLKWYRDFLYKTRIEFYIA